MQAEIDAALPPELLRQPVMPLVALHGAADIHAALAKHMPLIRAVDMQQLPAASAKPRRATYENYQPAGVLKKRWLRKHVLESAAAIAALVPWCPADEGDSFAAVIERINAARQVARRPGVLVVVVVVATGKVPDDVDQRYAQLHRTAELDGRLAALLVSEPDFALRLGAERLQHMLMEAAWAYMDERNKLSRSVMAHMQRPAQLALVVRHGIKLAFHLEHRDRSAAMKQYMSTYNDLCELAGTVAADRHPELKAIAEVLNLKICLILLQIVNVQEAQQQLLRHVATWRLCVGPDGALFLHQAWMARQHALFAQIVDDALASSPAALSPLSRVSRTTNSAIHWEAAANLVAARRLDVQTVRALPPPMPGEAKGQGEFWGQPESGRERYTPADVHGAWTSEKDLAHSEMVLALLDRAQRSNAAVGNHRRVCSLKATQARTLFELARLEDSKEVLLGLLAPDCPLIRDGWRVLEAQALELLLEVCRGLKQVREMVACSLRLIDSQVPLAAAKKKTLQDDLGLLVASFPLELPAWSSLRLLVPSPAVPNVGQLQEMSWAKLETSLDLVGVNPSLCPQVATYAGTFEREAYSVGDSMAMRLVLEGSLVLPIRLSSIRVDFSDDRYTVLLCQQGEDLGHGEGDVAEGDTRKGVHKVVMETLELKAKEPTVLAVHVPAIKGSSALCVKNVTLRWGGGACCILLPTRPRFHQPADSQPGTPATGLGTGEGGWGVGVGGRGRGAVGGRWDVVRVAEAEPDAVLAVTCAGPALVGERHRVVISVKAKPGKVLKAATLSLCATPDEQVCVCVCVYIHTYIHTYIHIH